MHSNQPLSTTALLYHVQKVLSKSHHPDAGDAQQRCSSDELAALLREAQGVRRQIRPIRLSTQLTSLSHKLDRSLSFTATPHLGLRTPSEHGSTILAQKLLSLITLSARIIQLSKMNISISAFTRGISL